MFFLYGLAFDFNSDGKQIHINSTYADTQIIFRRKRRLRLMWLWSDVFARYRVSYVHTRTASCWQSTMVLKL